MPITTLPIDTVNMPDLPRSEFPDFGFAAISSSGNLSGLLTESLAAPTVPVYAELLANVALTASTTIPANLHIFPRNGAKFTKGTGGSLTFEGPGIGDDVRGQIFSGFSPGEVKFTGQYPARFRPEWFGVVPNDSTTATRNANSAAIQVMFEAMQSGNTGSLGGGLAHAEYGGIVEFAKDVYYFNDGFQISQACIIDGFQARLVFGAGKGGIRVNGGNTLDEGLPATGRAREAFNSIIRNVALYGEMAAAAHTVTINGLTLTRNTGASFDAGRGYQDGMTLTIDGVTYVISTFDSANQLTLFPFLINVTPSSAANKLYVQTQAASVKWVGATLNLDGVNHTITAVDTATNVITLNSNYASFAPLAEINAQITSLPVANFTTVSARFNTVAGLDCRTLVHVDNVLIQGFQGNGLQYDSTRQPTLAGTTANSNNASAFRVRAYNNAGAGIYCRGADANNISFYNPDLQNNGIAVYDEPQHSNQYYSLHGDGNKQGVIAGWKSIDASIFHDPYIEGSAPHFYASGKVGIFMGTYKDPSLAAAQGVRNGAWITSGTEARARHRAGGGNTGDVSIFAGLVSSVYKAFLSFGKLRADDLREKYYQLTHHLIGRYGLTYFDGDEVTNNPTNTAYDPIMEFTNSDAPEGAGQLIFPKGFFIKESGGQPAASAALVGRMWYKTGDSSDDEVQICRKKADGSYEWAKFTLTTAANDINWGLLTNGGTASASSDFAPAGSDAANAFNGEEVPANWSAAGIWHSASGLPAYLYRSLPSAKPIKKFVIVTVRNDYNNASAITDGETFNSSGYGAKSYVVQTSEDGTTGGTWTDIAETDVTNNFLVKKEITLTSAITKRYFRLKVRDDAAGNGASGYARIAEFKIIQTAT